MTAYVIHRDLCCKWGQSTAFATANAECSMKLQEKNMLEMLHVSDITEKHSFLVNYNWSSSQVLYLQWVVSCLKGKRGICP